jgi:hypothetical protein
LPALPGFDGDPCPPAVELPGRLGADFGIGPGQDLRFFAVPFQAAAMMPATWVPWQTLSITLLFSIASNP